MPKYKSDDYLHNVLNWFVECFDEIHLFFTSLSSKELHDRIFVASKWLGHQFIVVCETNDLWNQVENF